MFGITIKGGPKMAGRLRPNCRTIYILEHTPNAGTVESQKFRGGGTSIIPRRTFKPNLSSNNSQLVG